MWLILQAWIQFDNIQTCGQAFPPPIFVPQIGSVCHLRGGKTPEQGHTNHMLQIHRTLWIGGNNPHWYSHCFYSDDTFSLISIWINSSERRWRNGCLHFRSLTPWSVTGRSWLRLSTEHRRGCKHKSSCRSPAPCLLQSRPGSSGAAAWSGGCCSWRQVSAKTRTRQQSDFLFFPFFHVALLLLNVLHWELRAHAASTALVSNRIVGFCRVLTGQSERTFKSAIRKLSPRKIFSSYFKRHGYFPRPDVCVCSFRDT